MPRVTFSVPNQMVQTAISHVSDLAYVEGLSVVDGEDGLEVRLSEAYCDCGRQLREERRGPAGTWARYCPLHGDEGGAA